MTYRRITFLLVAAFTGGGALWVADAFGKSVRTGDYYGSYSGYRPRSSPSTPVSSPVRTYYISPRIPYSFPYSQPPDTSSRRRNRVARVTVKVPTDAEVWINHHKTHSGKQIRKYKSRPLQPRRKYTYQIRARWLENGQEVVQERKVSVHAGTRKIIDLRPAAGSGKAVSSKSKEK
jgi:uncharacterized protein (TIGR03000 family)